MQGPSTSPFSVPVNNPFASGLTAGGSGGNNPFTSNAENNPFGVPTTHTEKNPFGAAAKTYTSGRIEAGEWKADTFVGQVGDALPYMVDLFPHTHARCPCRQWRIRTVIIYTFIHIHISHCSAR